MHIRLLVLLLLLAQQVYAAPNPIHIQPLKVTPILADELLLDDSANAWATRKITVGTLPFVKGVNTVYSQTSVPSACTIGDLWIDTDGTSGQRISTCETTNNWIGQAGSSYTDEAAQDAVGSMFTGNTETGITVTYNDSTGKVDFEVTSSGLTSLPTTTGQSIASTGSGAYEWVTDTVMSSDATAFTTATIM